MTVTSAQTGMKSTFSIGDGVDGGSTAYTEVGFEVTSITSPAITRETIDVTHLKSPDDFREYIAGLLDTDPATIAFNYNPSAADALYAAMLAGKGDLSSPLSLLASRCWLPPNAAPPHVIFNPTP